MHAASDSVPSKRSRATLFLVPVRSPQSPLTSSLLARSTAITAYTSATVASFTTLASRMDGGADRWRTFLSRNSHEAATSDFDAMRPGSILAKWWSVRARDWANAAIGC